MFSHVTIGSNDIARSKTFHDATLAVIGAKPAVVDGKGRLAYVHNGGVLLVTRPLDGNAAMGANGGTIGFKMESAEQALAWHKAGLENGGTSCEDPPGVRADSGLYLAYLRDPDGNKLCALYRAPTQ